MPGNAFIKFTTVTVGESQSLTHPGANGWNEITDWSWDIEAETSFLKGSGAAVGKPTPGTMTITHPFDTASPVIMQKIVQGTHFETVTLVMLKQTGQGQGQVYYGMQMKKVFISKVSSKGGEDGAVTQDVDMVFKSISIGYNPQKQDGTLDTTKPFSWDIAGQTEGTLGTLDLSSLKGSGGS